ncbi:MAG TPA: MFS transporter [Capillimicrobium sp.]|nr:MFS transporter [Capillimicrobium sp.]
MRADPAAGAVSTRDPPPDRQRMWLPIAVFAAAQFVMVLDSSVMNVSITQIVDDLDTTIQGVQLAITAYTLVMAALMLAGAKLGDILGRERTFALGLAIYGAGSLTTALSPSLAVLLVGWSLVEGIGAALVMPAIVALVAATYDGAQRALAFGVIGGVAGAAVAAGPLIGGWVTTELSWRYVFAGEVVIVLGILVARRRLRPSPRLARRPRLDVVGVLISSSGLALAVFGILKSSEWGLVEPRGAMTIAGEEITPFGFSAVPFLILAGLGCLAGFVAWEQRRERAGRDVLLDRSLLRDERLRAGLATLTIQQLLLLGTFFAMPVYLQVVLGFDAFETGKRLFPMSVAMFAAALAGPRLAAGWAPKRVAQAGLLAVAAASVVLLSTVDVQLDGTTFAFALVLFGVGAGLLLSQLSNVIMSSVPPEKVNEAGGLQGTAQNLGASLGTALIGAILIGALTTSFTARIQENPDLPPPARDAVVAAAEDGLPVVPVADVERAVRDAGLPADQASAVAADYGAAQLHGLERALAAVGAFALLGLWATRGLPGRPAPQHAADGLRETRHVRSRTEA